MASVLSEHTLHPPNFIESLPTKNFLSLASLGVNNGGALAREQKAENPKVVDSGSGTLFIYDDAIVFSPPLYRQRYEMVKSKIKEVSNGTFMKVSCVKFA